MHAAACQQPAAWLQTASAAAVAGCCSPWQLRAQGLQQPQVCFSCHDSWHPKHQTSGYIYGHWKMHAAACQQPAAWLQTASTAAVAGCCSPWQLRAQGLQQPQVCFSFHDSWHPNASNIRLYIWALENACSSMSTASSLAANCVYGCCSGLLQPLAVACARAATAPSVLLLSMTAGAPKASNIRL